MDGRNTAVRAPQADTAALEQPPDFDPFDRILLTTDGTVTTLLEACTGEPIMTRTTRETGPAPLDRLPGVADGWWRQADARPLAAAEALIARRVILRGARSGLAYVLAESPIAPERLLTATSVEARRELSHITAVRAESACVTSASHPALAALAAGAVIP